MNTCKSQVFNYLTTRQKAELCNYLTKFTKKYTDKTTNEILELYIEEAHYYLEMNVSRQEWIADHIENTNFHKDLDRYISELIKKYEYKEKQKPLLERQKIYLKEKRKQATLYKMSKTQPTAKQLSYFKSLCKKFDISVKIIDIEKASKLDLKNSIEILLSNYEKAEKERLLVEMGNKQNLSI